MILIWGATVLYQAHGRMPLVVLRPTARRNRIEGSGKSLSIPVALDYACGEDVVLAGLGTGLIALALSATAGSSFAAYLENSTHPIYLLVMMILLSVFSVLLALVKVDVQELVEGLKRQGSFTLGVTPGQATERLVEGVLLRTASIGSAFKVAIFAALWAACAVGVMTDKPVLLFSSLLVSVVLGGQVIDQIEALRLSGRYEGLLKKT